MSKVHDMFVADPPSQEIADQLNRAGAIACSHGRDPCYLRCGVRRELLGVWQPILKRERLQWLAGFSRGEPDG